jgi:hypothetical protein
MQRHLSLWPTIAPTESKNVTDAADPLIITAQNEFSLNAAYIVI